MIFSTHGSHSHHVCIEEHCCRFKSIFAAFIKLVYMFTLYEPDNVGQDMQYWGKKLL
jgi:hypothetical protein